MIKLPAHLKDDNRVKSATGYPGQRDFYGQSAHTSYGRQDTIAHSSHVLNNRLEDENQNFNHEWRQSWDDKKNSNCQVRPTTNETIKPIISRQDPRNKCRQNPDERRRISELRKSREELFTEYDDEAPNFRDYCHNQGKDS